ncbi:MAG: YifB family Mg chelatase-like AAA ATPase [Clostridia bacterium]|nr:YifB family Mg chelatase-like AAA ATPase [Clostridia bacterium]
MVAELNSCAVIGIGAQMVKVEMDFVEGVPDFQIVGLGDTAVKESRERVKAALKNAYIELPTKCYVANLAPADMKKEGSFYDLPLAIAAAFCSGKIKSTDLSDAMFLGELSLKGEIRPVHGVLPAAICAKENGIKRLFVPDANKQEAAVVEGLDVYPCKSLTAVLEHITGVGVIDIYKSDQNELCFRGDEYTLDFADVKGQTASKWALEVAAAGGHNVIMTGSPGAGKTMLAKRIPSIMPDLTFEEAIEITKVHSVAGTLPENTALLKTRPFRNPHHTVSSAGLAGGGSVPKPGEISLAHNGVLFLDEFPEFRRDAVEILRQPMENGSITVSRSRATVTYPSNFMLVAATNPCPCGFLNDPVHECTCSQAAIERYKNKISGPVLDRIDIQIDVEPVAFDSLSTKTKAESSKSVRERVNRARRIQLERFKGTDVYCNANMTEQMLEKYCALDNEGKAIFKLAFEKLGMSARGYSRILKVARTIADLSGCENITKDHIMQALRLRKSEK